MDLAARTWRVAIALLASMGAAQAADRSEQYQLSIERGPLAHVLRQLSQQTGLQIGTQLSVSDSKTDELGPYVGHATIDEALNTLLAQTDLWYSWQNDYTLRFFTVASQRTAWSSGVVTAKEASESIQGLAGIRYETGVCGNLLVGPFSSEEPMSAEAFWAELIKPYCQVVYLRRGNFEPGSVDRRTVAGQTTRDFHIDQMPRVVAIRRIAEQAGGVLIGYLSTNDAEERELVGLHGRMTLNKALQSIIRGSVLRVRWVEEGIVSVEAAYKLVPYADMSKCPCNFGFPELRPIEGEHVTVTESRLPSIEGYIPGRAEVYERNEIEASGASSVPDFLRHVPQLPYMRPRGFRLSGAQFAELRGLEPQYTLVLINGARADVSASDQMANAFDLQNIPLSAVDRIEIAAGSPSLVHGMDAIGGLVNIVLRDRVATPFATARYGSASGGARERIATVGAGTSSEHSRTALFIDAGDTSELLGVERDRWRNMNYTRYGGPDRRTTMSAPPNIYTLDGSNLPGLDTPGAAVSVLPSGEIAFRAGELNLTSPLAMQAIVPATRRASMTGVAEMDVGNAKLSGDMLLVHRQTDFRMDAEIVPGFAMAADHPQNPFGVEVAVDATLTGLPPRATNTRSQLMRGIVRLDGPLGVWKYHSFFRRSQEQITVTRVNFVDLGAAISGLASSGDNAINILSERPGDGNAASLLAPRLGYSSESGGTHVGTRVEGALPFLRFNVNLGLEYRTEYAVFDERVRRVERHEGSGFGVLSLPIGERTRLTYGMRLDDFSDSERVEKEQWGLRWNPADGLELHAAYNEAYHAPSLYDLYLPRDTAPVPLYDARRQEVTSVNFIFGGNPNLAPATGTSCALGVSFESDDAFKVSADLWRIRMHNHIAPVLPLVLLANESGAISGRILRDTPSALDAQAGRPGRLLALDVSRGNIGEVDARGMDLSLQKSLETSLGTFSAGLDLTYTDSFRYSDLPIVDPPMRQRAGIASVLGTIPSWRGAASVRYSGYGWDASIFGRYYHSYSDYSFVSNEKLDRDVPSRSIWDLTISKEMGAHIDLMIGVSDMLNRAPSYAQISDPLGLDISLGDLTGRTAFIQLKGSM